MSGNCDGMVMRMRRLQPRSYSAFLSLNVNVFLIRFEIPSRSRHFQPAPSRSRDLK